MWLYTKHGFVSAVAHKDDPEWIMLRARKRNHLAEVLSIWRKNDLPEMIETPDADYRWRCFLPRKSFVELASKLAAEIDYPNFKAEAQAELPSDIEYHAVLAHTWAIAASGLTG